MNSLLAVLVHAHHACVVDILFQIEIFKPLIGIGGSTFKSSGALGRSGSIFKLERKFVLAALFIQWNQQVLMCLHCR